MKRNRVPIAVHMIALLLVAAFILGYPIPKRQSDF